MIAYLRGTIISKSTNYFILENHDVGYGVFVNENFLAELVVGSNVEVYIHHHVREEASDLYGFRSPDDLELFESLLTVSGVGPKSALGVLNAGSGEDIREAIARGDSSLLTKVSGIGAKTAERIVLELRNKLGRSMGGYPGAGLGTSSDEIDALISLGYSLSEARAALNLVDSEIKDSSERVKAALKKMVRR